jgi:hypothetical protein
MAVADIPNIPPQSVPVMIAKATQAQQIAANVDRTIGVCQMISNPKTQTRTGQNVLDPVSITKAYFNTFEQKTVTGTSVLSVLRPPSHGKLEDLGTQSDQLGNVIPDTGEKHYYYQGQDRFAGQDSVTLLVEMGGYKVEVIYFFHVFGEEIYDDIPLTQEFCTNGTLWKISSNKGSASQLFFRQQISI